MKGCGYAWIILISKDEEIPQALLSLASLKRTKALGSVVALADGAQLSKESLSKIIATFDRMICTTQTNIGIASPTHLFAECWNLSELSRVVALLPGTLVLSPMNELFETEGLLINEEDGVQGIALRPSKEMNLKIITALLKVNSISEALAFFSGSGEKEMMQRITSGTKFSFGKTPTDAVVIIIASAESEQELRTHCSTLEKELTQPHHNIRDIAYSSTVCGSQPFHHQYRAAFVGSSTSEILKDMRQQLKEELKPHGKHFPRVCFTFPGKTGKMNLEPIGQLYNASPIFQTEMDSCASILERIFGPSMKVKEILFSQQNLEEFPLGLHEATVISAQYSLVQLWKEWGIVPNAVMGHCLGELPAAILAGVLSLADALEMIVTFSRISPKALPGTMLALNVDEARAKQLIVEFHQETGKESESNWLEAACVNSDVQTTVAGSTLAIPKFKQFGAEKGIKCTLIPVSLAIHSRAMEPVYLDFIRVAEQFPMMPQKLPYISSVTGKAMTESDLKPEHYANCFRKSVNFVGACETVAEMGMNVYLEIGFDGILSKLTDRNVSQLLLKKEEGGISMPLFLPSVKQLLKCDKDDKILVLPYKSLAKLYVKGAEINWQHFYQGDTYQVTQVPFPQTNAACVHMNNNVEKTQIDYERNALAYEIWA